MVRPDVSQPDGRAEGTGRRAAGAGDHLSAASATWLSISGLLRALRAPRQPPRHRRVSQPWPTFFLQGTEALGPPLVPIRPAWGVPGLPWHSGHLGCIWKGWTAAMAAGRPWANQARPGALTARSSRVARPPRCFPPLGCPPGIGRRLRPSLFPAPRVPSSVSASRPRRVKLELLAAPSAPSLAQGDAWPLPLVSFAPSVCPHLGFLPLIRCRSDLFTL